MSTDLLERFSQAVSSATSVYTKFALDYSPQKTDTVYCFVEGNEDIKYYGFRLKSSLACEVKHYICRGRDTVEKVYEMISDKDEYIGAKQACFIDKDYSKSTSTNCLYVTPCYSIENLYTSNQALIEILRSEFSMADNHPDFIKTLYIYEDLKKKFHDELTYLNAWLACQYDYRIQNNIKTRLCIDETLKKHMRSIIRVDMTGIKTFSDLQEKESLMNLFPNAPIIDEDTIASMLASFDGQELGKLYRGKFELCFFVQFINRVKEQLCSKNSTIFSERHKCTLSVEPANAISALTQYADTPKCLVNFIASIIIKPF